MGQTHDVSSGAETSVYAFESYDAHGYHNTEITERFPVYTVQRLRRDEEALLPTR